MQRLKRVQNNLARITLMILTRASAEPLLKAVHWLPVVQCIQYNFVMPINRVLTTGQPSYLLYPIYCCAKHFFIQHCRPTWSYLPFKIFALNLLHLPPETHFQLNLELRSRSSTGFVTGLKTFLFDATYICVKFSLLLPVAF